MICRRFATGDGEGKGEYCVYKGRCMVMGVIQWMEGLLWQGEAALDLTGFIHERFCTHPDPLASARGAFHPPP